jgi:hypothetical protein
MTDLSSHQTILRRRIKTATWIFITGLVVAGATAMPLEWELNVLAGWAGAPSDGQAASGSWMAQWLFRVRDAIHQTNAAYPFMSYGTDWLAFAHFVIAVAFIGPLRDPVRNIWVFNFGLIACALVVPFALVVGGVRGIPIYWRLIDCSFGVLGFVPLWLCRTWTRDLEHKIKG